MITSEIIEISDETPTVKTLTFKWDADVRPGQFIMVWVPLSGEIPMSVSSTDHIKSITVKNYGHVSDAILKLKKGDRIYFRGPYGRSFTPTEGRNLIIGGGSGMASLLPLINRNSYGIVSARNKTELLFADRFERGSVKEITDDGSSGLKGYPVDFLPELNLDEFEKIYVCGPELMLRTVFDYLKDRRPDAELSLERSMKCGIGVCDSCSIDGRQLCRDGPIFRADEIDPSGEFGNERLSPSGARKKLRNA